MVAKTKTRVRELNINLLDRVMRKTDQFARTSKRNNAEAHKWFMIARDDLEICEILHQSKHYAAATYHLQQALEKLTKCFYILSGRIEPIHARSHSFVVSRLKKEIKDEYLNDFLQLSKAVSGLTNKLSDAERPLEFIQKNEEELRKLGSSEIKKIFTVLDSIESKITNPHLTKSIVKQLKRKKILKAIRHIIFMIRRFRTPYSAVRQYIDAKHVDAYVASTVASISLNFLSLLTYVHCNTPRYPMEKDSEISFFEYTESFGIVANMDLIVTRTKKIEAYIEAEFFTKSK